uniref:Uncharacterized protein n=1 Tax=Brassica oleracea var. oleracea TaxID=109376 RepID=A0A0D3A5K0_BRAOL
MSDVSGASSGSSMVRSRKRVVEFMMERGEGEKKVFEKMEMKLKTELFDKMDEVLMEAKWSMKKMCAGVVIACIVGFVIIKLV